MGRSLISRRDQMLKRVLRKTNFPPNSGPIPDLSEATPWPNRLIQLGGLKAALPGSSLVLRCPVNELGKKSVFEVFCHQSANQEYFSFRDGLS